jgi:small neutral amino acid transporter SnatA (MarC family)
MAAFPIAIPLLAGPGAMTATVLLAGQADAHPVYVATLSASLTSTRTHTTRRLYARSGSSAGSTELAAVARP